MTFSDEEQIAKPSPEIFLKTLIELGGKPNRSTHIGDRPETDIMGAKGVGMRAILIGNASCKGLSMVPDAKILELKELPEVLKTMY